MQETENKHLTVLKGGRVASREFNALPFNEKLQVLSGRPIKERLDLIVSDPDGKRLVRAVPPFELYLLVKEIGDDDAGELILFASPEQLTFFLDLELWRKWSLSLDKAIQWFERLLEGGERFVTEFLEHGDPELLVLILMQEIEVGGGSGELSTDDERLADWDHTFDNLFFITFKNPPHSRIVGSILDIIHRNDHPLYLTLMERVRAETIPEMEEYCFNARSGRLADLGFPELDDALSIYAYVDPAAFSPHSEKNLQPAAVSPNLPLPLVEGNSLLQRVLAHSGSHDLFVELNYLINNALVADDADFSQNSAIEEIFQRVYGYLNIALESQCGNDEEKAARIIKGEYLKDLFRLGFSLVLQLRRRAEKLESSDYATGKVLAGLKKKRPIYYRGLDADGADGYREFREYADIVRTSDLLASLASP